MSTLASPSRSLPLKIVYHKPRRVANGFSANGDFALVGSWRSDRVKPACLIAASRTSAFGAIEPSRAACLSAYCCPRSRHSVSSPDVPADGRHIAAARRCRRRFTSAAVRKPRPCRALWPDRHPLRAAWPTIATSCRPGGAGGEPRCLQQARHLPAPPGSRRAVSSSPFRGALDAAAGRS